MKVEADLNPEKSSKIDNYSDYFDENGSEDKQSPDKSLKQSPSPENKPKNTSQKALSEEKPSQQIKVKTI